MKNQKKEKSNKVENTENGKRKINKAMIATILLVVSIISLVVGIIMIVIVIVVGEEAVRLGIGAAGLVLTLLGSVFVYTTYVAKKRYKLEAKSTPNKKDDTTAQAMSFISNYAFNHLLVAGRDYTVAGEVNGMVLVKKEIKWKYFIQNETGIQSIFTITTDIATFAFQVNGESIFLVPTDLVLSIYED